MILAQGYSSQPVIRHVLKHKLLSPRGKSMALHVLIRICGALVTGLAVTIPRKNLARNVSQVKYGAIATDQPGT